MNAVSWKRHTRDWVQGGGRCGVAGCGRGSDLLQRVVHLDPLPLDRRLPGVTGRVSVAAQVPDVAGEVSRVCREDRGEAVRVFILCLKDTAHYSTH